MGWLEHTTVLACKDESEDIVFLTGILLPFFISKPEFSSKFVLPFHSPVGHLYLDNTGSTKKQNTTKQKNSIWSWAFFLTLQICFSWGIYYLLSSPSINYYLTGLIDFTLGITLIFVPRLHSPSNLKHSDLHYFPLVYLTSLPSSNFNLWQNLLLPDS